MMLNRIINRKKSRIRFHYKNMLKNRQAMKTIYFFFSGINRSITFLLTGILLSACSPHPGAGVWQANNDNVFNLGRLQIGYDGRAEFSSNNNLLQADKTMPQHNHIIKAGIRWHCFWAAITSDKLRLDCTPSTDTEQERVFFLSISQRDHAELHDKTHLLSSFRRLDQDPSTPK